MTEADAEDETTPDRRLGGERLLGEHHRMPRIGRHHRGDDIDSRNRASRGRDGGQGVHTEDLRGAVGGESLRSRFAKALLEPVDGLVESEYGDVHAANLVGEMSTGSDHLSERKQSRTSATSRSGCSSAAKWPPRGMSVQWLIS